MGNGRARAVDRNAFKLIGVFQRFCGYLLSGRLRENVSDNEKNAYGAKKKNATGGAKRVLEIYKKLSETDKNRLESFAEQLEKLEAAEKL